MVSQKCLSKVYHSLLHSDLLQQTHNRADVVCIACMSITFSTPFGYTLDFVCSLLLVSIQANISNGHQERVLHHYCRVYILRMHFPLTLWFETDTYCSTMFYPSFFSIFCEESGMPEWRKKSIYKGSTCSTHKKLYNQGGNAAWRRIIYKARIFFSLHLHIPGHSILVPDGRPFGVAGVSGFLKNGVWLDWRGETWRDMEYEVMRWRHRISIRHTVPVQNTDTSMTRRGKRAPRHGILEGYASASAVVDNSASQIWATKRWRSNCFQIPWKLVKGN